MVSLAVTALMLVGAQGVPVTDHLQSTVVAAVLGGSGQVGGTSRTAQGPRVEMDLKFAKFDPLLGLPPVPASMRADVTNRMFIVQFANSPTAADRAAIEAVGGKVGNYLPHNAYLVDMSQEAAVSLTATGVARWIGAYEPAYRIEPETRALLQAGQLGTRDYYIQVVSPEEKASVAAGVLAVGGIVVDNPAGGILMQVTLTPEQVIEVARLNGIVYFDRRTEVSSDGMVNVRSTSGANFMETVAGYTGQGVIAHVIDGGVRATHDSFETPSGRLTIRTNSASDWSHGTSTTGIVIGNGAGNASGRGMMPNAQGVFTRYLTSGWSGRLAWTIDTVNVHNAVVESNSWGDALTGSYTTISAQMDDITFQTDLLICNSMSNWGTNTQVRPQAWAKNVLSVGGIYHQGTATLTDDRWNSGASVGPAADGRIKPELSFFYDQILCPTSTSDTAYTSGFGGTSAATPETAGAFGILFQMWSNGIFGNPAMGSSVFANRPKSTLAKALMINNARQYVPGANGNDITRMRQGWGLPWLEPIYNGRNDVFFINERDAVTNGQTRTYRLVVPNGAPEFKVTMCYTDLPAAASANPTRVNNLNLRLVSPGGTVYHGNVGLAGGPWSTAGGVADNLNTTENIFVQNPQAGVWTVEVTGASVVSDARLETSGVVDADYALVATGADSQSLLSNFGVRGGSTFTGTLDNLHRSDNGAVTINPPTTRQPVDQRTLVGRFIVGSTSSSELRITLEGKVAGITSGTAHVSLQNRTTGEYETVGFPYAVTANDGSFEVVVPNGNAYIGAGGEVDVRVDFRRVLAGTQPWQAVIDQLRVTQFQG